MRNSLNPMRNARFYGLNHGNTMRNTLSSFIMYIMRTWEMKKKNPFQQSEVSTHHSHTSIILMNQTKEWNPL